MRQTAQECMHVAVSTGAQDGLAAADARSFHRALGRLTCSEIRWLLAFVRLPVARQGPVGQHVVHDRSLSGVFLAASEQVGVPSHLPATGPTRLPANRMPDEGALVSIVVAEVYAFVSTDARAPVETMSGQHAVIENLELQTGGPTTYAFATDGRGRLRFPRVRHARHPRRRAAPKAAPLGPSRRPTEVWRRWQEGVLEPELPHRFA